MSTRLKAYSSYKESGVEWLGRIPGHWKQTRIRYVFRCVNGSTPKSSEAHYWDGDIPWVTPDDLGQLETSAISATRRQITKSGYESCGTTLSPAGSIVLSTRAPIGHLAIVAMDFCTNQGCRSLVFRDNDDRRYFYYLLFCGRRELQSWGQGSTFQELANDKLKSIAVSRPPFAEQIAIADFLDRETGKIDALVQKKERLIQLLQEKRTALISHAVTQGLNAKAPRKDSGIPWIGNIPAHWDVKRLHYLTQSTRPIMYGIVLPGPHVEGGVPIVKGGDVMPGRLRLDLLKRTAKEIEVSYSRSRLQGGDLLYAIRGSIGMVEMAPGELEGANLTQDAARIAPAKSVVGQWLLWALKSTTVFAQLDAGAVGATIRGINIRDLKRAYIPLPPPKEQQAISYHLDRETARLDRLNAKVRLAIERLEEYRTALISAAVTGQIDVRQAQLQTTDKPAKLPSPPFRRTVFAAEIIEKCHEQPTFGHVKFQKILHLAEYHLGLQAFDSNYYRQAAGPYDNQMLRSIDRQLETSKWFRPTRTGHAVTYTRMEKAGAHQKYFDQYWGEHRDGLEKLITLVAKFNTEQCEIVSTLYAVWNDFLLAGVPFDDEAIVNDAIAWHPEKQRIERDRWLKALTWMRQQGLVPRGTGKPIRVKK